MKKAFSLFLALAMALSLVNTAAFASNYSDTQGHWAEDAIDRWSGYGVINGHGGDVFSPNATMTRAEMAQVYVNLLGLTEKADISMYTDVSPDAWYADAVAKCVAAGVLTGTGDHTFSPQRPITREQMFVAFGRAMGIQPKESTDSALTDLGQVSSWAEGMVNALLEAGYVSGMEDSTLRPKANINRASVMALMDKAVDTYANEPGSTVTVSSEGGLVLVAAGNVTLTGEAGDVVIVHGAGGGSVTLEDATVTGTVTMAAADAHLAVTGESSVENLVVSAAARSNGVTVGQDAVVASVMTEATDTALAVSGSVGDVTVAETATGATVNTEKGSSVESVTTAGNDTTLSVAGTVGSVTVAETADNATVSTEKGSKVESVTTAGADTTLSVAGTVGDVTVAETASGATVSTEKGASVSSVTTAGSGTTVEGSGTVNKVEAAEGATDTSVTTSGTKVENNSSESVTTDKGTVAAGESGTTSGSSTSSGGSSGSGGGSSHSHSYTDGVCSCGAISPDAAQVATAEQLTAALNAGKTLIVLTNSFEVTSKITVTYPLTLNGNGKTITASNSWTGSDNSNKHLLGVEDSAESTADNVTIKNIVFNSNSKALGIQSYCVGNTKLENVTTTGSLGAGLTVNGSTVEAIGLHTSGNAWGGVNVDQGNGVTETTTFTFDATSTFGEQVAVYSDGGDVTVNAPEGWAAVTSGGKTGWVKLFNGGFGTEASPYEIANETQFKAMSNTSTSTTYYKLTASFSVSASLTGDGYSAVVKNFYGDVLDGNGYTITVTGGNQYAVLFHKVVGATFTNMDVVLKYAMTLYCTDTTFKDVDITGEFTPTGNDGAYVVYAYPGAQKADDSYEMTLNFVDCNANMTMIGNGDRTNYNAVFVGYAYYFKINNTYYHCYQNLNFTNCTNEGTLVCGKASMFLGNVPSPDYSHPTITVTNCSNNGLIQATNVHNTDKDKYSDNGIYSHFVSSNAHGATVVINEQTYNGENIAVDNLGMTTGANGSFVHGPQDTSLKLVKNEDGTFTITPAETTNVAYYEVSVGLYATLVAGGSQRVYVTERITASESPMTTTLKYLSFVDETWVKQNSSATQGEIAGNMVYTLDSATYYYYIGTEESSGATLNGNPKAPGMVSVSAYDANGKLLASTMLSSN